LERVEMKQPPTPFIVGMTRSGTTLLREMFSAHPDVFIPDESQFLLEMCRNHERYESAAGLDRETLVSDLCRHPKFQWWMSCEEAQDVLQRDSATSFSDAIRGLYRFVAQKEGKSRYGDKTPQAVTMLPSLAELFPESRFIHLIRDGRDVALSHLNLRSGIDRVEEVAIIWKGQIELGRRDGEPLGPERYREIHYENLIQDPEGVLRSLCEFVDLEFNERMLKYYEHPSGALGSSESEPQHESVRAPLKEGIRDWRKQMSRRDIEIFEVLAGDLLESLGYERTVLHTTPRMHRRARLARAYVAGKGKARNLLRSMGR
jgi:hypothetical protein